MRARLKEVGAEMTKCQAAYDGLSSSHPVEVESHHQTAMQLIRMEDWKNQIEIQRDMERRSIEA